MIAAGLTNPEIGERLGISLNGAKWHVSEVLSRLQVERREDAAELWHSHQAFTRRLRRARGLRIGLLLRIAGGAVAAGIAGGLVVLAVLAWREPDSPAPPSSPCDPENLIAGFVVVPPSIEPAAPPACVQSLGTVPEGATSYELDVPPGPYNQQAFEDARYAGQMYLFMRGEVVSGPALQIYRSTTIHSPPVIVGTSAERVDFLPGPGVMVRTAASTGLAWQETLDSGEAAAYYLWVFDNTSGLTPTQAASLLAYFSSDANSAVRWNPDLRRFVEQDRPQWTHQDDATTGIGAVDDAIHTFARGESVNSLADTVLAPCVSAAGASLIPPVICGVGQVQGTLIPAYLYGSCPDQLVGIGVGGGLPLEGTALQTVWLYAVAEVTEPEFGGLRYLALFTSGERLLTVALTESGVAGIAGGGSCPTPEVVRYARSVDSWLLPPLFPLPAE